jgi:cobalt-zinc-cadmium efflux system outer membrane protein
MKYTILFLFCIHTIASYSQNRVTIVEAEQLLQKNNLLLIAEQYNISASKAAVIQAKIWDLPYVYVEANTYNPQNNQFFDVGSSGEKVASIQQLIYLGGKKRNEIDFAKSNVAISELQFEQVLRNLKLQLSQTFYSVYYDKVKSQTINAQVLKLDTLLRNYEVQGAKGNIPLKDIVRLQSLIFELKQNKIALERNMIESQQTLALITGIQEQFEPVVDETNLFDTYQNKKISKDSIINNALSNNLDYLTAIKISESQETYLKWQKSLAIPDLNAGVAYDQRGGAFQDQLNLTLGIPLPLWNKNKGNIQLADAKFKQANAYRDYERMTVENKVDALWAIYLQQKTQYGSINPSVIKNLNEVYLGILSNFERRNISLLEFTDFMESYNQTNIYINEVKKAWILSCIQINYITNKEIF